jgi:hypothetical protein
VCFALKKAIPITYQNIVHALLLNLQKPGMQLCVLKGEKHYLFYYLGKESERRRNKSNLKKEIKTGEKKKEEVLKACALN